MTKQNHISRESWLLEASTQLEAILFKPNGLTFPERYQVSVGWPKTGKRAKGDVQGQCFGKAWTEDGTFNIFIGPQVGDPVQVLAILVHELIHAAVGLASGHKGEFALAHTRLGLVGAKTGSEVGEELRAILTQLSDNLGAYPHSRMHNLSMRKKIAAAGKTDRIVLRSVNDPDYYVYTSRLCIEEFGYPTDPWGDEFVPSRGNKKLAEIAASKAAEAGES